MRLVVPATNDVTPREIMRFTLIYDGDLPAGSSRRSQYASKIRNALHDQMRDLWDSHVVMRQIARTCRVRAEETHVIKAGVDRPSLPNYDWEIPPVPEGFIDLCAPVEIEQCGVYLPIVRSSLNLACAIDIEFLRHEEPLTLLRHGGDLDNRLKCFFDGLRMPDPQQDGPKGEPPTASPLCVLLEDDRLITDFSVKTGRLLGAGEKRPYAVRIQATVTVKVLRVTDHNMCLVGA